MCMSVAASRMSDTHLYVGEGEMDGQLVHVLAYQNTAYTRGPNAMVLPFPTSAPMGESNVIDTTSFKTFLKDISNATKIQTLGGRRTRGSMMLGADSFSKSVAAVFDVGSYTVVLAESVEQIPEALTRVPTSKRPSVSGPFLKGFGELYPDQPVAVCCWDGEIEAEPLLWWYVPRDASTLFIPTMDAHDGKAPKLGVKVDTDHIISVGGVPHVGTGVTYKSNIPAEVRGLIPTHVYGTQLKPYMFNDDCFVRTSSLHHGYTPLIVRADSAWQMSGWS